MNILLVTSATGPLPADSQFLSDRFTAQGHTVTPILQSAAVPSLAGTQLIVFAPTATAVGTKYDAVTVGIVTFRPKSHAQFSSAGSASNGANRDSLYVLPAANGDTLVGAATGTVVVSTAATTAPNYFTDTTLGSGAVKVLSETSALTTRIVGSRYPAGAVMADGTTTAPSRRVHVGLQPTYSNLNASGLDFLDRAVTYASGGNVAPSASAGADQAVSPNVTVTLAGSGTDPDAGDVLTYAWSQIGGVNTVTLANANTATATFTSPSSVDGDTLTFRLTVTDVGGLTATDDAVVTVAPGAYRKVRAAGAWVRKRRRIRTSGVWA